MNRIQLVGVEGADRANTVEQPMLSTILLVGLLALAATINSIDAVCGRFFKCPSGVCPPLSRIYLLKSESPSPLGEGTALSRTGKRSLNRDESAGVQK
jgi:hypothetical protein